MVPSSPFCTCPADLDKLMKVYKVENTPLELKYDGPDNPDYLLALLTSLAFHHM